MSDSAILPSILTCKHARAIDPSPHCDNASKPAFLFDIRGLRSTMFLSSKTLAGTDDRAKSHSPPRGDVAGSVPVGGRKPKLLCSRSFQALCFAAPGPSFWRGSLSLPASIISARAGRHVTKDDDVRFFPPGSASVIGQDLLERGFPRDASSSQLVLVYERKDHAVTPADRASPRRRGRKAFPVCQVASLARHRQATRFTRHAPDRPAAGRQGRTGHRARRTRDRQVSGNIPFQEDANRR